jgi:CDP-diacylglycerol---glycerol-3-phosphate 3-phosphatidyltransferase
MTSFSRVLLLALVTHFVCSTSLTFPSTVSAPRSRGLAIRGGSTTNEMNPAGEMIDDANVTQVVVQNKLGPNSPPPGFLRRSFPNFPWHSLPNILTYLRCLAIPALMVLFYQPDAHATTAFVFGFASFTDWLDGYFARRWDITSPFGAFLDPVADKLMVSTALILLSGRYGAKVAIPTSIILSRELAVSALREWMAQRGQRDSVKVGFQGKVKTAATMVALCILLLVPYGTESANWLSNLYQPGLALLYLCTVVTITSGSAYFRAAAPALLGKCD